MANEAGEQTIGTYPPHDWGTRPTPTRDEIDTALEKSRQWWVFAAGGQADECIKTFVDLFDRYLGEEVRSREPQLNLMGFYDDRVTEDKTVF